MALTRARCTNLNLRQTIYNTICSNKNKKIYQFNQFDLSGHGAIVIQIDLKPREGARLISAIGFRRVVVGPLVGLHSDHRFRHH